MCTICSRWEKGQLTSQEAYKELGDMLTTSKDKSKLDHALSVSNKILDKLVPMESVDSDMDALWSEETGRKR